MKSTIQTQAGKAIVLGIAVGTIFWSGYCMGLEHASNQNNPRYMQDVHRKAKELIAKAAHDVIRERREQRVVDTKFNDITKDQ
jgi:hypothetical protein